MSDDVKENLKDVEIWMRLIYMLMFGLFFYVAEIVLFILVALQFLLTLFTGRANARLLDFGRQLSDYVYQIVRYLTYVSNSKPFPFADWPAEAAHSAPAESTPAKKAAPARKPAAKKAAAKPKTDE